MIRLFKVKEKQKEDAENAKQLSRNKSLGSCNFVKVCILDIIIIWVREGNHKGSISETACLGEAHKTLFSENLDSTRSQLTDFNLALSWTHGKYQSRIEDATTKRHVALIRVTTPHFNCPRKGRKKLNKNRGKM